MAREYMTAKQIQDYKRLCRYREQGKILTPDGLRFICEACNNDPEEIGRHFLELTAKFRAEKGIKLYE